MILCRLGYALVIVHAAKLEKSNHENVKSNSIDKIFSVLSTDVLGNILKYITAKRSRARVVDKILSMGLVFDRRDLYKKRKRNAPEKSTGMVCQSTY